MTSPASESPQRQERSKPQIRLRPLEPVAEGGAGSEPTFEVSYGKPRNMELLQRNPLVPAGAILTGGVLLGGLFAFKRGNPYPRAKSGINFLLAPPESTVPDAILTAPPTPTNSSTHRLAALSLENTEQLPPINNGLLPPLLPLRARSADSGIPNQPFPPDQRFDSGFSAVTTTHSLSSGPSLPTIPATTAPPQPSRTIGGRRGKTEAELKEKREMRRMKNRISAARSRQRKTDTFETLQRELSEAKEVIEMLTRELDRQSGGRPAVASSASGPVVAVPQDLRAIIGSDFVTADNLMDLLRMYIRRSSGP